MRYTELLDCKDNMIFEGDKLSHCTSDGYRSKYYVKFGFYTKDDVTVYGFYLASFDYGYVHHMPEPDELGRLKLFNETRGEK